MRDRKALCPYMDNEQSGSSVWLCLKSVTKQIQWAYGKEWWGTEPACSVAAISANAGLLVLPCHSYNLFLYSCLILFLCSCLICMVLEQQCHCAITQVCLPGPGLAGIDGGSMQAVFWLQTLPSHKLSCNRALNLSRPCRLVPFKISQFCLAAPFPSPLL